MDYRKTAKEILNHVGGSKNIVSAAHCATRLRLVIADNSKADKTALENADGVRGYLKHPDSSRSFSEQEPSTKYLMNLLQSQASQPARKQKQKKLLPKSRTGL